MSVDASSYDVVVIGSGFAGCTAARDLTEQGNRVLLLEARDHLGGRTFTSKFPGTDIDVEMGGQYIVPDVNQLVVRELERYGVPTANAPWPEYMPSILNGKRHEVPLPFSLEQFPEVERLLLHCAQAAARIDPDVPYDHQSLADLDIPLSEFLAPLELSPDVYEFAEMVFGFYSFRYADEASALVGLHFLKLFDLSLFATWAGVDTWFPTSRLMEAMAAEVTEVRLDCPVVRVDQTGDDVLVTTAGGETVSASAVVVATPINIWNDIEFVPQLSEERRVTSSERHACPRTAKALLRVRNAPKNPAVFGSPRSTGGVLQCYTSKEGAFENGDQLMIMFAWASVEGDDYHLDFNERESVERALETMLPGAELVDYHHHDYLTDPFSKGDQISWRPGRLTKSHSVLNAPEGRLTFATADIALKGTVSIDGAVESGHKAARQTLNLLVREREAAVVRSH